MLPDFTTGGLLPPTASGDPYTCTPAEVRRTFVERPGDQEWRRRLFDGWDLLRTAVGVVVPSARWWLWGCFVSNHEEPLWGDRERIDAVVILPVVELSADASERALLEGFLRGAHEHHDVDVSYVPEVSDDHPHRAEIEAVLELKWRPRATRGVADHATRELVPAGFIEVVP